MATCNKTSHYKFFDIHRSGVHTNYNPFAMHIFGDNHLVIKDLCFWYHIIKVQIISRRYSVSILQRMFTMVWFLFFILLLISWGGNVQFRSITYIMFTMEYFYSWVEISLYYFKLLKRFIYLVFKCFRKIDYPDKIQVESLCMWYKQRLIEYININGQHR